MIHQFIFLAAVNREIKFDVSPFPQLFVWRLFHVFSCAFAWSSFVHTTPISTSNVTVSFCQYGSLSAKDILISELAGGDRWAQKKPPITRTSDISSTIRLITQGMKEGGREEYDFPIDSSLRDNRGYHH